jgi:hypothetical protein
MGDDTDVLLKLYEEQCTHARQSEDQRATITNLVLIVASAVVGFVSQNKLILSTLPLTVLLIVIGAYGAIASEKLYERFQLHSNRSRYLRKRIDELHPNANSLKLFEEADNAHKKEFAKLLKIRVHHIWFALHMAIAVMGTLLTIIVIFLHFTQ